MKHKIIITLIILLALFLRVNQIQEYPPSLYWDEVSIGYNGYSILQTGKDEWGRFLPLFFEAFGEFKFPVAVYLSSFSIFLFGLNAFAVRFPSVLAGTISCVGIYILGQQIFKNRKIALLSAFLFAISPWSIQFSRAMFESNISVMFLVIAVTLLINYLSKQKLLSFLFFIVASLLCIYSYGAMIIIFPLTVFIVILFFRNKEEKNNNKKIFVSITTVLALIYLPFMFHLRANSYIRFSQVSIFSQNPTLEKIINLRKQYGEKSKLIFNKYTAAMMNFLPNFISYLNPLFFFPGRDGNTRHSNNFGLIYPVEFIFFFFGILFILKNKKIFLFLISAFILPFAASSVTKDSPHALRSLSSSIFFVLISSCGLYFLSKQKFKIAIIIAYLFLLKIYLGNYFTYTKSVSASWGMENTLIMKDVEKENEKVKTIYLTGDFWRPYIYYYYVFHIDPTLVQKNNNSRSLKNIYFGYAKWDKGDRRYDYSFSLSDILSKEHAILYLSQEEKDKNVKDLLRFNFILKKELKLEDKTFVYKYEK